MEDVLYLKVPYASRFQVRSLGARWDPKERLWYVPQGMDPEPFSPWVFAQNPRALPSIFLLEGQEVCWRCHETTCVIAIASERLLIQEDDYQDGVSPAFAPLDGFSVLVELDWLPALFRAWLHQRYPFHFRDRSKTAGGEYLMNHCKCGAKLGDHYLASEPGGVFNPTQDREAKQLNLIELCGFDYLPFRGSFVQTELDLIQEYATQLPPVMVPSR